ncbi:hypothetical protein OGAPHI_003376 [Ogataea philodendri]|uniref:IPT/TIG domain-containing protein n=1 Tax=Ogataea philodendri TaxID=1378263 RepID=A0A9P8P891_9ASCO|nr:uncharacterized protein OGAPHI_003376 [Ogataea philodendri]KAH3666926.1 hypothetical protein OGAPHI_003376 [Ogataea philodendri]
MDGLLSMSPQMGEPMSDLFGSHLEEKDVLDEFLDMRLYEQGTRAVELHEQHDQFDQELHEMVKQQFADRSPNAIKVEQEEFPEFVTPEENFSHHVYTNDQSEEFDLFEQSRQELMKLKFGGLGNAPDLPSFEELADKIQMKGDTNDVTTSTLPHDYINDNSSPMYNLEIKELPSSSRVETQMKIQLSISPPPPQFLLHLPRDTIAKPKLTLESSEVPDSVKPHMLFLDTFVVGASNHSTSDAHYERLRSCNVCKRCMRREMKRASRRKRGIAEDSINWNLNVPRRAIIFNSKEVISFPRPTGNGSNEKTIDLLTRIVCYCRHHQEPNGFKLFFVLKDANDNILGRTLSKPILIMDRKKLLKDGEQSYSPEQEMQSIKQEPRSNLHSVDDSSSENTSASTATHLTTAASLITQQLPLADDSRTFKRQKRHLSPADSSSGTYYDAVQQHRSKPMMATRQDSVSSTISKKDPTSPMSSDNLSPQNCFGTSSATSIFSTTPEKKSSSFAHLAQNHSNANIAGTLGQSTASSSVPTIQRIIPAQGPIRGGIEVTLLGSSFRPGLTVKFGSNVALATHCWSDSTIVTYLPPASQPGPVLVTFEDSSRDGKNGVLNSSSQQVFTYTDDSDRQLVELALQIVGLKMNGKLEDAKNIAKRIIGNNSSNVQQQQQQQKSRQSSDYGDWVEQATLKMTELSKTSVDHEEMLLKFLSMLKLPNSPIAVPNWAICTPEGQTMLHLACIKGYGKLCRYLVENGCKLDYRDMSDITPLHYAFVNGQRGIIKLLVNYGAVASTKLNNGLTLKDISDSNVLDLLEGSTGGQFPSVSRRLSNDSIDSIFDAYKTTSYEPKFVTVGKSGLKSADFFENESQDGDEEDEFEADDEDELESDADLAVPATERASKTETTGVSLWLKMSKAFGKKLSSMPVPSDTDESEDGQEELLPSYQELFPTYSSSRSLINFRGHDSESKKSAKAKLQESTTTSPMEISLKASQKTLDADKRLLFFWLPFMLLLLLVLVGNQLELITLDNFTVVSNTIDGSRNVLGRLMLGKERFTGLLNENLNYGRERVNNLLNDVNGAVFTAVAGR